MNRCFIFFYPIARSTVMSTTVTCHAWMLSAITHDRMLLHWFAHSAALNAVVTSHLWYLSAYKNNGSAF